MKILHTITCNRYVPGHKAHEEFTRNLIRNRRLTLKGAERILRRGDLENYGEVKYKLIVTNIQYAIYA